MSTLDQFVTIQILLQTGGVTQAGFGVPMILSHSATWVERVRFYADIAAVASDFATTTPEYLAANAIFSQNPAPEKIAIGRAANKPTQRWKITVATVANSTVYKFTVGANTASFTSDGSATNDEIVAGLVSAINGLSGDTCTASAQGSVGSQYIQLIGDSAGAWNAVQVVDTNLLSIEQDHADPGVAADLTAIKNETDQWYCLLTLFNSKAYVLACAAWTESNEKLYLAATQDMPVISTAASGGTDVASTLKGSAYFRTACIYHPNNGSFIGAAEAGVCLPFDPGSETWKFKTLAGVAVTVFTGTQKTNMTDKYVQWYDYVAGKNITNGDAKVSSGEYIDVVRFRDWLKARMQERIFTLMVTNPKIPFTDAGIALIQIEILAVLSAGVSVGGLADNPAPTCTVPKALSVAPADRSARKLTGVKFGGRLAGAIHAVDIKGVVTT